MVPFFELFIVAAIMTVVLITVIRWYPKMDSLLKAELLFFVLIMMAAMFLGALFFLIYPSVLSLTYAVGANMAVMVLGLVFILRNFDNDAQSKPFDQLRFTLYFSILIVLNEALMGFVFKEAQTGLALTTHNALTDLISVVNTSVNTYWFFTPMMSEMISALTMLKRRSKALNGTYFGLVGATAFSPTLVPISQWINIGFFLTLVALACSLYYGRGMFQTKHRRGVVMAAVLLTCVIVSYLTTYWALYGAAVLLVAIWFYDDVFRRKNLDTD